MTYTTIRFYKNTRRCSAVISEKILSIQLKFIISKMKYLWPKKYKTNSKRAKSKLTNQLLNISEYQALIDLYLKYILKSDIIYNNFSNDG